ncbi:uncharacterized protein LOC125557473 [Nematostella vectensis]|uniref:uncharacterized protein LOC125557473 n=1 Tax=Nematostella vectensis TaxID=45351 RepID=UPI002077049C|nr:uncharacterized protein LOC125557473 [Nematostella vectensis]
MLFQHPTTGNHDPVNASIPCVDGPQEAPDEEVEGPTGEAEGEPCESQAPPETRYPRRTYQEAMESQESENWRGAMKEEMDSLLNDTFSLTNLPEGRTAVGGRWVYTIKEGADGDTFKARYVAKGYNQKEIGDKVVYMLIWVDDIIIAASRFDFTVPGRSVSRNISRSGHSANRGTPEPTTGDLVRILNELLGNALSSGSQQAYARAWNTFRQFYHQFYRTDQLNLPLGTPTLALFISYLRAKQLAASTILSYMSSIGYVHKLKGMPDPTQAFIIHKLLTAVKKQKSPDVRLPITETVLHQLVDALVSTNSSASQRTLFKAMFMAAFYGFFRIGELIPKISALGDQVVQIRDLALYKSGKEISKLVITTSHFQHTTSNRPFEITIARLPSANYCPVRAIMDYCAARGSQPGPLFLSHGNPVSMSQFSLELNRCLSFCELDTSRYKSHSFRIGAVCHTYEKGYSDSQIRAMG